MDEKLAEAINKSFYEDYENWKHDQGNPSTDAKVIDFISNLIIGCAQLRHWVSSLRSHLGDDFTPQAIVSAIDKASIGEATLLKDRITKEFRLGTVDENRVRQTAL